MIAIDCEMTGLDPELCSILSIGAVDILDPSRTFYGECRVFEGARIDEAGLRVCGFTEEDCYDQSKPTPEELIAKLHEFVMASESHILVGQNVYLDREFMNNTFERAGIDFRFHHRMLELHSIAYAEYIKKGKRDADILHVGGVKHSTLNLDRILEMVGLPEEPRPHNALTGAKVSAEVFARMCMNTKLLPDFSAYEIQSLCIK